MALLRVTWRRANKVRGANELGATVAVAPILVGVVKFGEPFLRRQEARLQPARFLFARERRKGAPGGLPRSFSD